jgi:putative hemolysin
MVPRTEIVAMRTSSTIGEVLRRAADTGFSSIPVFRDRIDNVSGVVRVKDWFRWRAHPVRDLTVEEFLVARPGFPVSDALLVHPPFFTPETRRVADLFADLMRHGSRVAFLVDEFGGVSGSVTVEDIVEEVMGEIVDEHDDPDLVHELAERAGEPSAFDVAGRVSVEIVNRRLGLSLDEELAQTIGGYVIAKLNRIPVLGDAFTDEDGVGFEVTGAERNRVLSVVLRIPIEHR